MSERWMPRRKWYAPLLCWLRRRHRWGTYPYPSRLTEGWQYERLPWLIEDPLIWHMQFEVCNDCRIYRWVFDSPSAADAYHDALARLLFPRSSSEGKG